MNEKKEAYKKAKEIPQLQRLVYEAAETSQEFEAELCGSLGGVRI